ncbi:DsbA family oxidoreductase, partial [Planktotalea frisia]|nr:DsbA family oxidoreductase [Planktotalea frisia]
MVKLDIISDPICPWCYIGKTLLDRALEAEPEHPFEIEWHPFQLNPDMPMEGMDRRAYLERKFGGKKAAVKVYGQIDQHARDVGLELDLGGIKRTPNTLNAHRLIHWAGIEQRQSMVVSAMFRAYFKEGRDISDVEVLADLADTCGMDAALIQRLLATD